MIGLSQQETELFCGMVQAQHGRNKTSRMIAETRLAKLQYNPEAVSLQLDAFQVISDWYHLAILQLVQLKGFSSDPKWIAKSLGIHPKEVEAGVQRLLRLELLSRDAHGKLTAESEMVFAPDGIPSEAIRKFHQQVLQKAMDAVTTQTVDERYLNTTVLPVRSKDLPKAKEKIKAFHREFDREFTPKAGEADHVYALAIQFFSVTQKSKGEVV